MTYVFVFLGEFGYELFNWQGAIRRFARQLRDRGRIICCSRANLFPLYELAGDYIDISELPLFKQSVACGYFALSPVSSDLGSRENLTFDHALRAQVRSTVRERLGDLTPDTTGLIERIGHLFRGDPPGVRFVFSSERTIIDGCVFGCRRRLFGVDLSEGCIYEGLDITNNAYEKITADRSPASTLAKRTGIDLSQPFVLCQSRARSTIQFSQAIVPKERLIASLAARLPVVLMSFGTGRHNDSYSSFADRGDCAAIQVSSFPEQACLISMAAACVFFTEGDFGSHIYVPPFLGRDVLAIAPRDIYAIGTTPIDSWNRRVFSFGGQIFPLVSEEVFASERSMNEVVQRVVGS